MYRNLIYIIALLLFSSGSWGQKLNYQTFTNIIPSAEASTVNCFAQDAQGLVWIGTNKGLFSYDGYSAQQHFTFGEKSNTLIHSMLVYGECNLLLATDNGLLIYNYTTDRYEETDTDFPSDVRAIAKRDNILWIGSLNGLFRYNLDTKELENVSKNIHSGLPHNTIYSIITTRDNTLYIGTYNGFCKYIPEAGTFETIDLPADNKRSNRFINSLLEDTATQNIWIGTEGALYKYIPGKNKIKEISCFHDNSIKSLAIDGDNNLVLATDNGLYTYNHTDKSTGHFVHDSRNSRSLSNNIIWGVFADKEKNIWLGTDYGISLSRNNKSLQSIPISHITGVGDGNRFHSIFKDSRGNYWFGGTNGLIFSPSLTERTDNSVWYRMGDPKYPISHNRIRHIYEDKKNNLWVATDGSINRYDYQKKQFIHYTVVDSTNTLNSNWAYYMFEDDKGQLWIATCLGGIFVVNRDRLLNSSGNYIAEMNYSTRNGLSGDFVNQIIPDRSGNVWVLLYNNGINKINVSTSIIEKFPIEQGTNNENPNYIICDNEGFLWAGYRGRLARINTNDGKTDFIKFDNFSNSEILSLIEVNDNIWISTTDGLWTLDKKTNDVRRLNVTNKSFTCFFYDKDIDKIYMGGVDEFAVLSPDIQQENLENTQLILTALYVNDDLFESKSDNSIRYLDEIELNYDQNNLTFEFSDLIYSEEEAGKFVYRLEGVDADWNILRHNANRVNYTNLEYGKYKLIISRLDSSGKPSDISRTFSIRINPPWYYTIWAKCIYAILLLGLIVWIINFFRVRHNLRIERIEKEKTVELTNLKIDFFTNVSHEFKTPLSLIIAPVSKLLLETKDPSKKRLLENVQHNALKLNSLIRQVLEFNRTDSISNASLMLSKVEFVEFAKSLYSIYQEGYRDKNLNFSFHANQEKIFVSIDVLKIESVLNNLLSNSCKYTEEGGHIDFILNYKEDDKILDITLSDQGIGIPAHEIPYIFERYYQTTKTAGNKEGTGIGLYLAKTYTEQHGGKIHIESVEDKGTSITISLPVLEKEESYIRDEQAGNFVDERSPLILIVDDNPEIADFISQTLSRKYRCIIAHNGKMGLEMAISNTPDLIVADIMMPVMDGLEMSRRIRKNVPTSTIPIILLTAKDDKSTELESINLSVDAFISKPFDPELLLSRVDQLLRSKEQIETKLRIESIDTPKAIEATSPDERFLSEIIRIIESKIADPDLNVNALSTISGIGSKQIYRKIKQLTGLSPVEYIRSIRLKKAAMLLSQNKFTVAEVMYMVGFSNHSYFSKCFQSEFGKTPRQFMEDT
ncbi:signal transduction histidine kinase/ligand-binding sensor domain-containing protein/DNA-binding response OmpR family regulator [Dysgonomonas hofstadii]|uniref:histidine kinase n=1 Tax=Dysgonomonas hofstadii TaxID=637886 RepID=A0A840CTN7_9BACT|nr:two-component regulator propeller domain-containing protein [Dysgonomonas hofstadii]MBB4038049.1 signal transduction histidine kinase/ligand-binding sensor domain-containing protein/DNA-binding response OmpR family regulator [Dysgonomonas hofstadii]